MGHKKWSSDEELMLIKKIASGQKIEHIAKEHDRTIPAVLKRLEKITYENIESGKSAIDISNKLHLKPEVVHKLYTSYKKISSDNPKIKQIKQIKQVHHVMNGGAINNKLEKLMLENKVISELILNKNLTKQLNELIVTGKIDGKVKNIVKFIRNM